MTIGIYSLYAAPAVLAFIIKLVALFYLIRSSSQPKLFAVVVGLILVLNFSEIMLIREIALSMNSEYLVKAYYAISVLAWMAVFAYVCEISGLRIKRSIFLIFFIGAVIAFVSLSSDFIVAGAVPLGNVITAERGPVYPVWQLFCFGMIGLSMITLYLGYRRASDHQTELRNLYTALALSPIFIVCLAILVLMFLEIKINAVILLPLATSLFMVIQIATERQHKVTDLRRFVPFSQERKTYSEIMDIFSSYSRDEVTYREAVSEIERLLVLQKYDKNQGNASETAGRMGMPRSSLYSIFNRLGIESRGEQKS